MKVLFLGIGSVEGPATKNFSDQLTKAGIHNVYFESPGTAHEWLTWRRCLEDFAPRLFQCSDRLEDLESPGALFRKPCSLRRGCCGRNKALVEARIKIDTERVIGDIDPKIYGNFIEHLGRCIEGGVFEEKSPLSDATAIAATCWTPSAS